MWSRALIFLRVEGNRAVLGLIGGALVALATGVWAVFVYLHPAPGEKSAQKGIVADCGSLALQGNVSDSNISVKNSAGINCASEAR